MYTNNFGDTLFIRGIIRQAHARHGDMDMVCVGMGLWAEVEENVNRVGGVVRRSAGSIRRMWSCVAVCIGRSNREEHISSRLVGRDKADYEDDYYDYGPRRRRMRRLSESLCWDLFLALLADGYYYYVVEQETHGFIIYTLCHLH